MADESILEIIAQGAWNGGTPVDNANYENKGMFFKGGIPVTSKTIEERIGVRTRICARQDERIGVIAFRDLLATCGIDPRRIRVIIAASNVGEDKYDPGPFSRFSYDLVQAQCPQALVFDLYAGCPGFNVAVETLFMLSTSGVLGPGDLSIIVGAENIHRAKAFKPLDTSNLIFGDDALATALETGHLAGVSKSGSLIAETRIDAEENLILSIANGLADWARGERLDGIIVDNQLGKVQHRIPAIAARIQHAMIERLFPEETAAGLFQNFRAALDFYDTRKMGFAFDVMSLDRNPEIVKRIAGAYTASGKYRRVASVFLAPGQPALLALHEGPEGGTPEIPRKGIIDSHTRTHGCFASFIELKEENGEPFGEIDGKGVFLHATRGATHHLSGFLDRHRLTMQDIDLLIEHQANFAMIPLTLEQVMGNGHPEGKEEVARYIAEKMVTNVHLRGNCSVVCMQRLPYDLQRGTLQPDSIQGYPVNRNLNALKGAHLILFDSVGAGMTRSTFLMRR
jgi:3-oxoacyl-[acyl-carrier-protein] synthase III